MLGLLKIIIKQIKLRGSIKSSQKLCEKIAIYYKGGGHVYAAGFYL